MPQTSEAMSSEEYAARLKGAVVADVLASAQAKQGKLTTVTEIEQLSKDIFCSFVGKLGPRYWDLLPVAKASMDAAETFLGAFKERYATQAKVPAEP